jgi:hypothetical protein
MFQYLQIKIYLHFLFLRPNKLFLFVTQKEMKKKAKTWGWQKAQSFRITTPAGNISREIVLQLGNVTDFTAR